MLLSTHILMKSTQELATCFLCSRLVIRETSDVWINLHHLFCPMPTAAVSAAGDVLEFLWGSERSGFQHLYLYHLPLAGHGEAALQRQVTMGDWLVETVHAIDASGGLVYFSGTLTSPLERHLYVVPLYVEQGTYLG